MNTRLQEIMKMLRAEANEVFGFSIVSIGLGFQNGSVLDFEKREPRIKE